MTVARRERYPADGELSSFVATSVLSALLAGAYWTARAKCHFYAGEAHDYRTASYHASAVLDAVREGRL